MNTTNDGFKFRLGLFLTVGLALFVVAIFIIGKQKSLFDPVYKLQTHFNNVSGLQVGSNVRFSGINVGTIDEISIINDSVVKVGLLIRKDVSKFIKIDCATAIGSEGLIGDKILFISQGTNDAPVAKENDKLESVEPIDTDDILASLQITAGNAELITQDLAEIMSKINNGNGTLGRLIQDPGIANNLSQTLLNLKNSSKGLHENMEAVKHNFLLKGYFKKKEKAALLKKELQRNEKTKNKDAKTKK